MRNNKILESTGKEVFQALDKSPLIYNDEEIIFSNLTDLVICVPRLQKTTFKKDQMDSC